MKKFSKILIITIIIFAILAIIGFLYIKFMELPVIEVRHINLKNVQDGSYIGEYKTFMVKVVVKVDVINNEITSIEIIEHQCGLGKKAEKITKEIEKLQSLDVDIISGATISSKVILKAVEIALSEGKNRMSLIIKGVRSMGTLIVYATKYGCTEKCAVILSEKLTGEVDLYNLKTEKVLNLSQYDKVIIGGSIYMGRIQKEISDFCIKNLNLLKEKKIGLFICCMRGGDIAKAQLESSFPRELLYKAVAQEVFGGEFMFKKMSSIERFIVRIVAKLDKSFTVLDTSKDMSNVSDKSINRFAQRMNNVCLNE
ncbi:flavodoxin domain-containing protein [Caloranaerobacter azorensis]|nr:flavodoxin domain-containing protein [Caloranaerobacter azorensis]